MLALPAACREGRRKAASRATIAPCSTFRSVPRSASAAAAASRCLIRLVDEALAAELIAAARGRGSAACRMSTSSAAAMSAMRWRRRSRCCRCTSSSSRRAPRRWRACRTTVETRLTPMPEEMVRERARRLGLRRADPRPRARFPDRRRSAEARRRRLCRHDRLEDQEGDVQELVPEDGRRHARQSFARLVSPIGGDAVKDKRPRVIAALAAAEIMTALLQAAPATVPVQSHTAHV